MEIPIINTQIKNFKTFCPVCKVATIWFASPNIQGLASCITCGIVCSIATLARNEQPEPEEKKENSNGN